MTTIYKAFLPAALISVALGWFSPTTGVDMMQAAVYPDVVKRGEDGEKGQEQQEEAITPDPLIQSAIRGLVIRESGEAFMEHLGVLREESGESFERLIPQLIYHSIRSQSTREGMIVGFIIDQLEIRDWQLVHGLIPYLGTGDPKVEREVRNWLGGTEDSSASRAPDYAHYRAFIQVRVQKGEELPRSLIHYMYDSEPGTAVLTLMRAHVGDNPKEKRPILWAEHQVADVLWKWRHGFLDRAKVEPVAAEALARLVGHPRWWARLYVAEILRQHPAFRTEELIAVLLTDPDESVRSVVMSFVTNNAQDD